MVTNSLSREQLISKIDELENKLALAEKAIIDSNNQDGFSVAILEEFTGAIPWKYDLVNDKYIFVGNQLNDFLGYNKKDWVEINSWETKIYKDDKEQVLEKYRNALKDQKGYESEYRMIKNNGDICWIHDIVSIIRNEKGEAVELIGYMIDVTERLKIKNELLEKQRFLQTVFDGIQAPMHVIDKDFKVVLTNKKLLDLKGVKQEEIISQFCYQAYQGINKLCDDCGSKNVFETGKPSITTKQLPLPDNQFAFFEVYSFPIFDEKGKVSSVIEMTTDITEKKKAELALTESEKNFRLLFEKSPLGIYIADTKGNIIDANNSLLKMLGSPSLEMTKQINVLKFPRLVENGYTEIFKEAVSTKKTLFMELDYTSKWNKNISLSSYIIPLLDENGEIQRVYTIMEDITERKKAESALIESENRLRTLINSTPDIICFKDGEGRWLIANESDLDLFQLLNVNYFGKTDAELAPYTAPIYKDAFLNCMITDEEAWKKGDVSIAEEVIPTITGEEKTFEVIKVPVFEKDNSRKGLVVLGRDISERKKAERIIIENQRLGAIGEMAASVAHDFNNSLQSILGNLELALKKGIFDEKITNYLQTIKKSTIDAANRVKMIQRFGGKTNKSTEMSEIKIAELIEDVIQQTRPIWKDEAESKGISVKINLKSESKSPVLGNLSELRTVFYNLIKNSLEAMQKGGEISVTTKTEKDKVIILISDTGIGMDEETRKRVFQPFFTTKGFEIGRGLGLSGVYSIIKEHNGNIFIKETALNKGTTIKIELPIRAEQIETKIEMKSKTQKDKKINILWVEDDKIIRDIAADIIETLEQSGEVVSSGKEAIELLKKKKYDIVITDIGMPEMNGWQVAEKILEMFKGKQKVAIVSGWGAQIRESEKEKFGISYVIDKPMRLAQIEKLINDVLESE